ncbi:MAG TPA: TetR/AcrR family transcriptional regulator [Geminocystis sp. M7585_C2015_104]|nr:TetR/AcrR family transcriptional regulator [Geminocystis sp. M7585_C2015_104]
MIIALSREDCVVEVDKTEKILAAALKLFLENGYRGTTMEEIAKTAGVSKQTLYSHFGDKEGLFKALVTKVSKQKFNLVWAKPLRGKPEVVLRNLANRIIREVSEPEYLDFIHLIVTEVKNYPEFAQLCLTNISKPAISILTNYLENCRDLSLEDPEAVAHIFVNSILYHVLTQEKLEAKKVIPIESKRLINNLIKLIVSSRELKGCC